MKTIATIKALRKQVAKWRKKGHTIGLVPTMGSLHDGHLTLIKEALKHTDKVITTIFVNPTQFGQNEDLDSYPRTQTEDAAKIKATGGHALFAPNAAQIYSTNFSTRVIVDNLTDVLCGQSRPGHFDGVSQVVTKLLNMAQADQAFFGEKDWQQLAVIQRLTRDLNIATKIKGVPTVRDAHGLALSSRNGYLTEAELQIARQYNVILKHAAAAIKTGAPAKTATDTATKALLNAGFQSVDYIDARTADTLTLIEQHQPNARIFAAAHLGSARLIDNHPI